MLRVSKPAISKRLRVLEETGVLRRTIEIHAHQTSIQPGVLSEGADWVDRKRVPWVRARSTSSTST